MTIELVGETANISKCKSCLIKNEIISTDQIDEKRRDLIDREHKPLISSNGKFQLENVVDQLSCVAHGLIGKIELDQFKIHAAKFGEIDSVKSSCPGSEWNGNSFNTFLVKYKLPEGIESALKVGTHFYQNQEFKFIPYRIGDMESERQSRIVILANLPSITESDLVKRFEPEGIVAARVMDTKEFGYLLLAKKSTAQRMHKNGNLDFYHGHTKNHQIQTLDLSHVSKV